jgi:DNA invertase Pin-like site-specific DNA recombinase
VLDDTDVSGSVAVADRKLERLVKRVEEGASGRIVTPYLDRFGRDLIEWAVALKRISEAGGKLVSVSDGFDSTHPGSNLNFNLRMAIAQDFLERSKANWQAAVGAAADRGPRVPPAVRLRLGRRPRPVRGAGRRAAGGGGLRPARPDEAVLGRDRPVVPRCLRRGRGGGRAEVEERHPRTRHEQGVRGRAPRPVWPPGRAARP